MSPGDRQPTGAAASKRDAAEQVPFQRLIKLIERELELAGQGRTEELHQAVEATGAYMRTLPTPAPESARVLVARADALRARVRIEAQRLQEQIGLRLATRRRGRRIASSYAGPPARRYSTTA